MNDLHKRTVPRLAKIAQPETYVPDRLAVGGPAYQICGPGKCLPGVVSQVKDSEISEDDRASLPSDLEVERLHLGFASQLAFLKAWAQSAGPQWVRSKALDEGGALA